MIIDGHTHLYSRDTERYPLGDPESAYRPEADGSADTLKSEMDAAGVDRALTITAGFYGWDNSSTMDALAGREDWLAAGVLVDPASEAGPDQLTSLVEAGVSGIRIQRHLFYQRDLDDPVSTPLWERASDLGLTVDVNAPHPEYGAVEHRVREFPNTRFILDHCGYVSADLAPKANTVSPAVALSRYPNVYAKLTFLPLASQEAFPFPDVHWMVRELVDVFGPERCLFGTNFPQAQYSPHVSYGQIVELFAEAIDLSLSEREWILGDTAGTLWKWGT
jgi:predicted TIM-barrel fold metal-dependent hydrolase